MVTYQLTKFLVCDVMFKNSITKFSNDIITGKAALLQVPETKDLTDDELLKILDSDDLTQFRIPMCIGEPHAEVDKSKEFVCVMHYCMYGCGGTYA